MKFLVMCKWPLESPYDAAVEAAASGSLTCLQYLVEEVKCKVDVHTLLCSLENHKTKIGSKKDKGDLRCTMYIHKKLQDQGVNIQEQIKLPDLNTELYLTWINCVTDLEFQKVRWLLAQNYIPREPVQLSEYTGEIVHKPLLLLMNSAVIAGDLEMVQLLHQNNFECNARICQMARAAKKAEIFKYLISAYDITLKT